MKLTGDRNETILASPIGWKLQKKEKRSFPDQGTQINIKISSKYSSVWKSILKEDDSMLAT